MIIYKERKSFLHSVDPRLKILWLAAYTVAIAVFRTPEMAVAATLANLLLLLLSLTRMDEFARDGKELIIFSLIPIPLQVLASPYGLEVGLRLGVLNAVLLANMAAAALMFVSTTLPSGIADALRWFRVPKSVAFTFSLAIQFVPILYREVREVRMAQMTRGAKLTGPMSVFPLIIPSFHKVMKRAEELSVSLECRGFSP